ncbi:MAG: M56 family metallopeptidase [Defluviitaleaceae bacterium]|nr:M56 family metallopeptidase [Defluviitaleaceae bacterium]
MQHFLITLLICSGTMSGLALLYKAISPFLARRYAPKGRYYAWLIMVVGFIIPFRPRWHDAMVRVQVPTIAPPTPPVPFSASNVMPGNFPMEITPPVAYANAVTVAQGINWWQVGFMVWLAGALVFLMYHGVRHYRFVKATRRWGEGVTDPQALSLLENVKAELGITGHIPLYSCPLAGSPMMIGLVKPKMLLPTTTMAADELYFILKHELVHYKRKDLLYKYLTLLATAMHWFNPVVYFVTQDIKALCEMSCDVEVVQGTDRDTRQLYSEAIIGVVQYRSRLKTALSTNFYGGKNGMKKRILSIMDGSKKRMGAALLCGVLALTAGTGFLVATANAAGAEAPAEHIPTFVDVPGSDMVVHSFDGVRWEPLEFDGENIFRIYDEFAIAELQTIIADLRANEPLISQAETDSLIAHIEALIAEAIENGETTVQWRPLESLDGEGAVYIAHATMRLNGVLTFDIEVVDELDLTDFNFNNIALLICNEWHETREEALACLRASFDAEVAAGRMSQEAADKNFEINSHFVQYGAQINSDNFVSVTQVPGDGVENAVFVANTAVGMSFAEMFAGIEAFGVTFGGEIFNGGAGNIYYHGQLVGALMDDSPGHSVWISSYDRGSDVNIRVLRCEDGQIVGVEVMEG